MSNGEAHHHAETRRLIKEGLKNLPASKLERAINVSLALQERRVAGLREKIGQLAKNIATLYDIVLKEVREGKTDVADVQSALDSAKQFLDKQAINLLLKEFKDTAAVEAAATGAKLETAQEKGARFLAQVDEFDAKIAALKLSGKKMKQHWNGPRGAIDVQVVALRAGTLLSGPDLKKLETSIGDLARLIPKLEKIKEQEAPEPLPSLEEAGGGRPDANPVATIIEKAKQKEKKELRLVSGDATLPNEYKGGVNEDKSINLPHKGLFGIFDGMGGHKGGVIASEMAKKGVEKWADKLDKNDIQNEEMEQVLLEMLNDIKQEMVALSQQDNDLNEMGTTFSLVKIWQKDGTMKLTVCNIGDSRVYAHTADQKFFQLSIDHSKPEAMLDKWLEEGEINEDEADQLRGLLDSVSDNNDFSGLEPKIVERAQKLFGERHGITNWMGPGGGGEVQVDTFDLTPGVRLIITSDGVHDNLTLDEIAAISASNGKNGPDHNAQLLVERSRERARAAIFRSKDDDNTAIVIDVEYKRQEQSAGLPEVKGPEKKRFEPESHADSLTLEQSEEITRMEQEIRQGEFRLKQAKEALQAAVDYDGDDMNKKLPRWPNAHRTDLVRFGAYWKARHRDVPDQEAKQLGAQAEEKFFHIIRERAELIAHYKNNPTEALAAAEEILEELDVNDIPAEPSDKLGLAAFLNARAYERKSVEEAKVASKQARDSYRDAHPRPAPKEKTVDTTKATEVSTGPERFVGPRGVELARQAVTEAMAGKNPRPRKGELDGKTDPEIVEIGARWHAWNSVEGCKGNIDAAREYGRAAREAYEKSLAPANGASSEKLRPEEQHIFDELLKEIKENLMPLRDAQDTILPLFEARKIKTNPRKARPSLIIAEAYYARAIKARLPREAAFDLASQAEERAIEQFSKSKEKEVPKEILAVDPMADLLSAEAVFKKVPDEDKGLINSPLQPPYRDPAFTAGESRYWQLRLVGKPEAEAEKAGEAVQKAFRDLVQRRIAEFRSEDADKVLILARRVISEAEQLGVPKSGKSDKLDAEVVYQGKFLHSLLFERENSDDAELYASRVRRQYEQNIKIKAGDEPPPESAPRAELPKAAFDIPKEPPKKPREKAPKTAPPVEPGPKPVGGEAGPKSIDARFRFTVKDVEGDEIKNRSRKIRDYIVKGEFDLGRAEEEFADAGIAFDDSDKVAAVHDACFCYARRRERLPEFAALELAKEAGDLFARRLKVDAELEKTAFTREWVQEKIGGYVEPDPDAHDKGGWAGLQVNLETAKVDAVRKAVSIYTKILERLPERWAEDLTEKAVKNFITKQSGEFAPSPAPQVAPEVRTGALISAQQVDRAGLPKEDAHADEPVGPSRVAVRTTREARQLYEEADITAKREIKRQLDELRRGFTQTAAFFRMEKTVGTDPALVTKLRTGIITIADTALAQQVESLLPVLEKISAADKDEAARLQGLIATTIRTRENKLRERIGLYLTDRQSEDVGPLIEQFDAVAPDNKEELKRIETLVRKKIKAYENKLRLAADLEVSEDAIVAFIAEAEAERREEKDKEELEARFKQLETRGVAAMRIIETETEAKFNQLGLEKPDGAQVAGDLYQTELVDSGLDAESAALPDLSALGEALNTILSAPLDTGTAIEVLKQYEAGVMAAEQLVPRFQAVHKKLDDALRGFRRAETAASSAAAPTRPEVSMPTTKESAAGGSAPIEAPREKAATKEVEIAPEIQVYLAAEERYRALDARRPTGQSVAEREVRNRLDQARGQLDVAVTNRRHLENPVKSKSPRLLAGYRTAIEQTVRAADSHLDRVERALTSS